MVEKTHQPELGGDDQGDLFTTKLDVWRFLKEDGWDIGRSQFYSHCKDGLLRPDHKTGEYTLDSVEKYAKLHVRRKETGSKVNEKIDRMQEEKLTTELAREKIRLQKEIHDLGIKQKKFIPRDEFELAVVGRTVALVAHLRHMVQMRVPDWVDIVNGDQALAAELVEEVIQDIEMRLADFAKDVEFDVILEAD